jgi:hypothetical protein
MQIIGLASVHVDCDLERDIWHGINVVVVTDKLFVDGNFRWDVSGRHCYAQLGTAPGGQLPGDDGLAGEYYPFFVSMPNLKNSTVISIKAITVYQARVAVTFTSFTRKCFMLKDGQFHPTEALEATGRTVETAKTEKMAKMGPLNGANQISNPNFQPCQNGTAVQQVEP